MRLIASWWFAASLLGSSTGLVWGDIFVDWDPQRPTNEWQFRFESDGQSFHEDSGLKTSLSVKRIQSSAPGDFQANDCTLADSPMAELQLFADLSWTDQSRTQARFEQWSKTMAVPRSTASSKSEILSVPVEELAPHKSPLPLAATERLTPAPTTDVGTTWEVNYQKSRAPVANHAFKPAQQLEVVILNGSGVPSSLPGANSFTTVPEPSPTLLLILSLLGGFGVRRLIRR